MACLFVYVGILWGGFLGQENPCFLYFLLKYSRKVEGGEEGTAGGVSNREWKEFQREFGEIVLFAAFKLGKSSPYTPGRPQGRGDTKDGKGYTLPFSPSPCGRGMSMLWGRSPTAAQDECPLQRQRRRLRIAVQLEKGGEKSI